MYEQVFIPEKINVGYQKRSDTYTGQLGYVIYYDQKGTLRKETSWEGWRDKKLGNDEFKNEPQEGFVINRGGGGVRESWGWNTRHEFVRVYDPRNFEFEISIANLLYILQECNSIKGKGLDGKFVYGWSGTTLCLLPVDSPEYKKCQEYTSLQDKKVSARDLVPGYTYSDRKQQNWLYMGRMPWHEIKYQHKRRSEAESGNISAKKQHIFVDKDNFMRANPTATQHYYTPSYYVKNVSSVAGFAECVSDEVDPKFAKVMDRLQTCKEYAKPVEIVIKPVSELKVQKPDRYSWLPKGAMQFNTDGIFFNDSHNKLEFRKLNVKSETQYTGTKYEFAGYSYNKKGGRFLGFEDAELTKPMENYLDNRNRPSWYYENSSKDLSTEKEIQQLAKDGKLIKVFVKNEVGKEIPLDSYL